MSCNLSEGLIEEGDSQGQAKVARAIEYLLSQNRIDDLRRLSVDADFRQHILDEIEGKHACPAI